MKRVCRWGVAAIVLASTMAVALPAVAQEPNASLNVSPTHGPGGNAEDSAKAALPNLLAKAGTALVEPDGTLSWKALGRIGIKRHENTDQRYGAGTAYFAEPIVSAEVKALVGQRVKVKGYVLPRAAADGATRFLVAAKPAADADGCASGGAETWVDVVAKAPPPLAINQLVVVEGTLALFDVSNWSGFIYRLTDVRIVNQGAATQPGSGTTGT